MCDYSTLRTRPCGRQYSPDTELESLAHRNAAYGGVYVATALVWLRVVDGVKLSTLDWTGAAIALCGMAVIVSGWSRN